MKRFCKIGLFVSAMLAACLAGCNIFNPIDDARLDENDPEALTYEGYVQFRKGEYSEARRYFNKAIAIDSSYSDAWYGLSKAVINQQHVNIFELLRSVSADSDNDKISEMSESTANLYSRSIDSVMVVLDKFIDMENQGKTDNKTPTKTFSADYTVLRFAKTALELRAVKASLGQLLFVNQEGEIELSLDFLNSLSNKDAIVDNLNNLSGSLKKGQKVTAALLKAIFPELKDKSDEEVEHIADKLSVTLDTLEPDENGNYRNEDVLNAIESDEEYQQGKEEYENSQKEGK